MTVLARLVLSSILAIVSMGMTPTSHTAALPAARTSAAAACGPDSATSVTLSRGPLTIIRRSLAVCPTEDYVVRGTVSCQSGEHLLSGGYQGIPDLAFVDNYPSTSDGTPVPDGAEVNSWTMSADYDYVDYSNGLPTPLFVVFAACLRSDAATSRAFATNQTIGQTLSVSRAYCPVDQALTGGGYRTGWQKPPGLPRIVASFPDPALTQTWAVAGGLLYEPFGSALRAQLTAYAVCVSGAITTTTTLSNQIAFDRSAPGCVHVTNQPSPALPPSAPREMCTLQVHLACAYGLLIAGADLPMPVAADGRIDTSQWESQSTISVSRPSDPSSSADVTGWTIVDHAYYYFDSFQQPTQVHFTVVVCATPIVPRTIPRTTVAVPLPTVPPPPIAAPNPPATFGFRNLAAYLERAPVDDTILVVLTLLLLLLAVAIVRTLRRRAKRRRTKQQPTGPAQMLVDPGTPVNTIRMDGPHLAVTARFDPSAGTYTWRERTS